MNLVFKNNVFTFNGKIYEQLTGVAMGTPLASTLAILFMSDLEEALLSTQKFTPYFYTRYIDDIYFLFGYMGERI